MCTRSFIFDFTIKLLKFYSLCSYVYMYQLHSYVQHIQYMYIEIIMIMQCLLQGFMFTTSEGPATFYGTLVSLCGDNPGSCAVAGFKESSSAFRMCRQCMCSKDDIQLKVDMIMIMINNIQLRNYTCSFKFTINILYIYKNN